MQLVIYKFRDHDITFIFFFNNLYFIIYLNYLKKNFLNFLTHYKNFG